jgi:hypothetical protein
MIPAAHFICGEYQYRASAARRAEAVRKKLNRRVDVIGVYCYGIKWWVAVVPLTKRQVNLEFDTTPTPASSRRWLKFLRRSKVPDKFIKWHETRLFGAKK